MPQQFFDKFCFEMPPAGPITGPGWQKLGACLNDLLFVHTADGSVRQG